MLKAIQSEKTLSKHILKHSWTSGCVTEVSPITFWTHNVTIQLDSDKRIFGKCIERIVAKHPELFSAGIHVKSDGSCPAEIRFFYAE